jgi:hypothetical protein
MAPPDRKNAALDHALHHLRGCVSKWGLDKELNFWRGVYMSRVFEITECPSLEAEGEVTLGIRDVDSFNRDQAEVLFSAAMEGDGRRPGCPARLNE